MEPVNRPGRGIRCSINVRRVAPNEQRFVGLYRATLSVDVVPAAASHTQDENMLVRALLAFTVMEASIGIPADISGHQRENQGMFVQACDCAARDDIEKLVFETFSNADLRH